MTSSPKYKNLMCRPKQSPIELKEKLRKNYKNKIQNCRGFLMDKLRGPIIEEDLHQTIIDIYKSMFNYSNGIDVNDEEYEIMEELRKELIQEEMEWCIREYEKFQQENLDWSSIEEDNDVICPVCQKTNVQLDDGHLKCNICSSAVKTNKSLPEIKRSIFGSVDSHSAVCNTDAQFGLVSESNESHVYLICDSCSEMKLII
ncbi:unnamed protein product [Chrysodeixis includens]|uniref:RPA-interacting protein C-terminal domain-containing protein n=1 Tax=Chrysodeixis includens TaxID=689277 RepID=A0A9P0BUT0_CHRIL|nr:unnamed protein product [Chrysodeixis includens]